MTLYTFQILLVVDVIGPTLPSLTGSPSNLITGVTSAEVLETITSSAFLKKSTVNVSSLNGML